MKTRAFNIIERAANEFGYEYDMNDSLQDILDEAMNVIEDNVEYDRLEVCERSAHYDHVSWSDGKGFDYEADGEFISSDDRNNEYVRESNGGYIGIDWFEHTADDYVVMCTVIDTDGQKVGLICK